MATHRLTTTGLNNKYYTRKKNNNNTYYRKIRIPNATKERVRPFIGGFQRSAVWNPTTTGPPRRREFFCFEPNNNHRSRRLRGIFVEKCLDYLTQSNISYENRKKKRTTFHREIGSETLKSTSSNIARTTYAESISIIFFSQITHLFCCCCYYYYSTNPAPLILSRTRNTFLRVAASRFPLARPPTRGFKTKVWKHRCCDIRNFGTTNVYLFFFILDDNYPLFSRGGTYEINKVIAATKKKNIYTNFRKTIKKSILFPKKRIWNNKKRHWNSSYDHTRIITGLLFGVPRISSPL